MRPAAPANRRQRWRSRPYHPYSFCRLPRRTCFPNACCTAHGTRGINSYGEAAPAHVAGHDHATAPRSQELLALGQHVEADLIIPAPEMPAVVGAWPGRKNSNSFANK